MISTSHPLQPLEGSCAPRANIHCFGRDMCCVEIRLDGRSFYLWCRGMPSFAIKIRHPAFLKVMTSFLIIVADENCQPTFADHSCHSPRPILSCNRPANVPWKSASCWHFPSSSTASGGFPCARNHKPINRKRKKFLGATKEGNSIDFDSVANSPIWSLLKAEKHPRVEDTVDAERIRQHGCFSVSVRWAPAHSFQNLKKGPGPKRKTQSSTPTIGIFGGFFWFVFGEFTLLFP